MLTRFVQTRAQLMSASMPWSQEEDEILDDLVASFGPRPRILARQNAFPRFRSTKAIKVRRVRSHHVRRGVAVSKGSSLRTSLSDARCRCAWINETRACHQVRRCPT